ncbi:MAG: glycosyltransferase family 10 [Arenicellales bacterium]
MREEDGVGVFAVVGRFMVFVTAVSPRYFPALKNLVGSIHYWAPDRRVVVYNLGLEIAQLAEIDRWRNTTVVREFLPGDAPPHVRVLHTYAWKPVAIGHAIGHHDAILWIDAGSDLRSPPDAMLHYLETDGHFFVQGQDLDMTLMSHDGCYEALGATKSEFKDLQHFAGNLQGYVRDGRAHRRVLRPLVEHALEQECIAPAGSNLSNHRFDQTLLSILIYRSGLDVVPHTELLSARREDLERDPDRPSAAAVYTARGRSAEYAHRVVLQSPWQRPVRDPDRPEGPRTSTPPGVSSPRLPEGRAGDIAQREPLVIRSGRGTWSPPEDLRSDRLSVVACTSHFFGDDYIKPFDLPTEWGVDLHCNFTDDPSLLAEADAWWFHGPSITSLPKEKNQPWILMSMESERNWPLLRNPDILDRFDIHVTYRLDADVPAPYPNWRDYGDLGKPPVPVREKNTRVPAIYIASNPVPYRDAYVAELMTHMPVDSLGACLNNKSVEGFVAGGDIWRRGGFASILEVLPTYKFYLVFENSLSRDYVTERVFHALAAGTVPVYCGADNVEEFLPADDAVIKVRDFPGPRALAEYLLHLDQDERAYEKYLAWKERDYSDGFRRLLDIGTIDPRYRMAVKLAHHCPKACSCGGRLRGDPRDHCGSSSSP